MVFGYGHLHHRVHENLPGFECVDERRFHVVREQAGRLHALLQHRKMDRAVGFHANRAREFRRVVDRNGDQVVDPQFLRRQILPAGFFHQLRAHLRQRNAGYQRH